MAHVLIVGGGLAGCTCALELANSGLEVTIIEKSGYIGGKVRNYGCKATDRCNNCGLCLAGSLWGNVESNDKINIITDSQVVDVIGSRGGFKVIINTRGTAGTIMGLSSIVVSIGFREFSAVSYGSLEFEGMDNNNKNSKSDNCESNIITGYQLEKMAALRNSEGVFDKPPVGVAFVQCFGSRDVHEKAFYCSKVCCAYSTRMARVLRQYYPDMKIVFFYMDLQQVGSGEYFDCLLNEGIEFIRCKPVKIKCGSTPAILYEEPGKEGLAEQKFNYIVLSEGIHPSADIDKIAEICMLGIDENGFLKYVSDGSKTGIYIAGCASGPKKIEEVCAESLQVAGDICGGMS